MKRPVESVVFSALLIAATLSPFFDSTVPIVSTAHAQTVASASEVKPAPNGEYSFGDLTFTIPDQYSLSEYEESKDGAVNATWAGSFEDGGVSFITATYAGPDASASSLTLEEIIASCESVLADKGTIQGPAKTYTAENGLKAAVVTCSVDTKKLGTSVSLMVPFTCATVVSPDGGLTLFLMINLSDSEDIEATFDTVLESAIGDVYIDQDGVAKESNQKDYSFGKLSFTVPDSFTIEKTSSESTLEWASESGGQMTVMVIDDVDNVYFADMDSLFEILESIMNGSPVRKGSIDVSTPSEDIRLGVATYLVDAKDLGYSTSEYHLFYTAVAATSDDKVILFAISANGDENAGDAFDELVASIK